jgi:23S rRNA U2552 (ribose-2'-O)-methylase RlmE/FtsJ
MFTYKNIECCCNDELPQPYISTSLSHYLNDIKSKINHHEKEWNSYKKYTNPYEYIHTLIPNKKKCVSKYKPLSRSYFKMVEILTTFKLHSSTPTYSKNSIRKVDSPKSYHRRGSESNLQIYKTRSPLKICRDIKVVTDIDCINCINCINCIDCIENTDCMKKTKQCPIKTFHIAEGPGGFIEAIVKMRNNPEDVYIGMTILDEKEDYNIPAWKKSQQFLKDNPNVFIENGKDKTGNILKLENFVYCKEKYASSIDLITADGGFDFSLDFNNQEVDITKLLFAQIAFAVCMQKKEGSFVLKIFDSFMLHTIDMLNILASFYEKVYITKPQTSRYANSEKYIVCKKFLFQSCDDFYPYLYKAFETMTTSKKNILRFLNTNISTQFLTRLEEFNSIFGQQQIENIYFTISLIETKNKDEKIETLLKNNVQKCIHWCTKYEVPYHFIMSNSNIFLEAPTTIASSSTFISVKT